MRDKQWVQHISGQGEKWAVVSDDKGEFYECEQKPGSPYWVWVRLPKSEYRLCDPPEQWVDVTGECVVNEYGSIQHNGTSTMCDCGYRRRKLHLYELKLNHPQSYIARDAFIIEKKVSQ